MSAVRIGKPGPNKGGTVNADRRAKISEATRAGALRGTACPAYRDGKAKERFGLRCSLELKRWRYDVFSRDGFTCRKCRDASGGNLRAHHIKPFATHPDLRFEVSNGLTLCHPCHEAEHYKPDSIRNARKLKRGERLY